MPRIVVVNNYSLERVWNEVKAGQTPDHYLYGVNYFAERGYEVEIIPLTKDTFLSDIQRCYERAKIPVPIGNLEQQELALSAGRRADLIYAPCQTQTHLLGYMRALGLFKTPIVCLAHQPLNPGRLALVREPFINLMMHGYAAFPSLSAEISESINKQVNISNPLAWGPDREFFPTSNSAGHGVVAAGRTGRDFRTFGRAASRAGIDAQIICLESNYLELREQLGAERFADSVKLIVRPDDQFMPYAELMRIYGLARVLAIPLYSTNHLNGLSSLVDALGVGKPVIMTRNPYIDIDIEALGIGRWVEPNDENSWLEALQFFEANPDVALEMGRRARSLVDAGLNSRNFANQVMDIFDRVLKR